MIYGYIRVSSDKQTVENQRFEINNFCERNKLTIGLKKLSVVRKITRNDNLVVYYVKCVRMISSYVVNFHVLDVIFL